MEVLTSVAIAAMVSTMVWSLLSLVLVGRHKLAERIDEYESVRIPVAMFMQDARYMMNTVCQSDHVRFRNASATEIVVYRFATYDPTNSDEIYQEGIPDGTNLHRWDSEGGVVTDETVGWNLVPPVSPDDPSWLPPEEDGAPAQTYFYCPTNREAQLVLVAVSSGGEVGGIQEKEATPGALHIKVLQR